MSKDAIPSVPKQPMPKSKGKKPKPPKLKAGPTIKPLDVFKVALSADAGADPSDDSSDALNTYIKEMSGPQLNKLDKLVQNVQHRILESEEEQLHHTRTCERLTEIIADRRSNALKEELILKKQLQKSLDKLRPSHIERSASGKIKSLCIKGNELSIKTFISKYLRSELSHVESLLAEGVLLPKRKQQKPGSFLHNLLNELLGENS